VTRAVALQAAQPARKINDALRKSCVPSGAYENAKRKFIRP
jgi:hypothetical protein